eukprot:TRINITY_DN60056_c0_g1_i1.p1 TRINITY_DN60056_c0_g1~~TRINITY_DN60056_c0_g1_i1.p1  ORF type:complete len:124 (+),score=14.24 TRINITY_DN60056_c0_g1_i1:500-871(+)
MQPLGKEPGPDVLEYADALQGFPLARVPSGDLTPVSFVTMVQFLKYSGCLRGRIQSAFPKLSRKRYIADDIASTATAEAEEASSRASKRPRVADAQDGSKGGKSGKGGRGRPGRGQPSSGRGW